MALELHNTENPISNSERLKINENWQRIMSGYSYLQQQIKVLAGGAEVDELIQRLNEAIDNANVAVQEAIDANNTATQEAIEANNVALQTALDTVSQTLEEVDKAISNTDKATSEANVAKQGALDATAQAQTAINTMQSLIKNLGHQGTWSNTTQYFKNNMVVYNGSTFIALQDSLGKTPPTLPTQNNTYWSLLAERGAKGDKGEKGDAGTGVTIIGSLPSESELPATGNLGDAYLIAGYLYVWNGAHWENVGKIQGPEGPRGPEGPQGEQGPPGEDADLTEINQVVEGLRTEVTEHLVQIATKGKLGHIKPDGVTITVDAETGVASAKTSGGLPYGMGTTTDGANYSVTIEGITSYTAGMAIAIMPETNNTGAVYINVNGLGSKRAMYQTSVFVNSPDSFRYGIVYMFIYNGGTFVMQGTPIKLNDTFTSTSTIEAATANAVKQVNDKLIRDGIGMGDAVLYAVSIGHLSKAYGAYNIAIGYQAKTASMNGSMAVGYAASATETNSSAFGRDSVASGAFSTAIGSGAKALNKDEGTIGVGSFDTGSSIWKVPGSFSVSGTKQFEIPHPNPDKKDTHVLRHGAVESPTTGDTLYRYFVDVRGDIAEVQMVGSDEKITLPTNRSEDRVSLSIPLPDYWIWLNINEQVFISPDKHFSNGYGFVDRNNETLELTFKETRKYNVALFGTRNDSHESIQKWHIKGVEREIGESWLGETNVFEIDEITEVTEFEEVL